MAKKEFRKVEKLQKNTSKGSKMAKNISEKLKYGERKITAKLKYCKSF